MASSICYGTNTSRLIRLLTITSNVNFPKHYTENKSISINTVVPKVVATVAETPKGGVSIGVNSSCKSTVSTFLRRRSHNVQQINCRQFSSLKAPLQSEATKLLHQSTMQAMTNRRFLSSREITKNLTLFTSDPAKIEVDPKTLQLKKASGNPLVMIMAWLMAKQKHLKKYADIYTKLGFDVMVVHVTPWQLLWPVKGTQVVAAETLKFLENNKTYSPIVIHGFSVGAYQIGEVMLQMSRDPERYKQILDRIACQIWDSAADITEIPEGVPKAIFPKNPRMQSALRNYVLYHMKTFHNQATVHYIRSSQMFHSTLVKAPALFFVAENDTIGPPSSNQSVRENWERTNVKVTFKCWKHSQHAGHLIRHREEYLECLMKHLEDCRVIEGAGLKMHAKL